ncbi:MAG: STAS domain-containing protein [Sphingomonas sp.]|uniref:STAS domain-containing protein n=1 Tax=Sphingomonas sp. TaxID=28214 RepID=UPI0035A8DB06|nr:STAS domain-containing protein [Sphingomonas sp.]
MTHSTLVLPARCDRQAADDLLPKLRESLAAGDVVIDGKAVVQLGQSMLQLLLSARKTAWKNQTALTVSASEAIRATLATIGAEHLIQGGKSR